MRIKNEDVTSKKGSQADLFYRIGNSYMLPGHVLKWMLYGSQEKYFCRENRLKSLRKSQENGVQIDLLSPKIILVIIMKCCTYLSMV